MQPDKALNVMGSGVPQAGGFGASPDSGTGSPPPQVEQDRERPQGAVPEPDALAEALLLAREAGAQVATRFGAAMNRSARQKVSRAFTRALLLLERRKGGRKRNSRISAAYEDHKAGVRGLRLYSKHIAGYDRMSRWRRWAEARKLNEAIRSRSRRDKARQHRDDAAELAPLGESTSR